MGTRLLCYYCGCVNRYIYLHCISLSFLFSTLAGSTIMLLTIPWLGGLILGRVDIINGEGKDKTTSKFSIKSFYKQVQCCIFIWETVYS